MRNSLLLLLAATCCVSAKKNVVFFLVDDMGWTDLAGYGSTFHESPNLDALAARGVRFTNAYTAASICSPSRASIVTGRHPVRVGITDWIPGLKTSSKQKLKTPEDLHDLPQSEVAIGKAFKAEGYDTWYGGKWHLGYTEGLSHPTAHGFDVYFDETNGKKKDRKLLRESAAALTKAAVSFVQEEREAPFFLLLSYRDVHTPIQPISPFVDHFRKKAEGMFTGKTPDRKEHSARTRLRQDSPNYASMVAAVDSSVGDVLQAVDRKGLRNDTVVVFFSDNGGLTTKKSPGPTSVDPLRAGKGWLYEGGVRVPLIIDDPEAKVRGVVSDAVVVSTDIYPTLLSMAGLPLKPEQHVDGIDISAAVDGEGLGRRTLYWHYPHYHGSTWTPGAAIRHGRWKLVEFFETDKVELYDLFTDIGEQNDLASSKRWRVRELRNMLSQWRQDIGAKMPERR